jgi:hypothetical protein
VTLRTRLTQFDPAPRLRLLTIDQTVIGSAGTAGMLILPLAVDAAPAPTFAGAGAFLIVAALGAAVTGRRAASRVGALTLLASTRHPSLPSR